MTIEEKEKNYFMSRKLECAKSMLMIIKNDINRGNGATEGITSNALECVIDFINTIQLEF